MHGYQKVRTRECLQEVYPRYNKYTRLLSTEQIKCETGEIGVVGVWSFDDKIGLETGLFWKLVCFEN